MTAEVSRLEPVIISLQDGEALIIRVDPDEFTEEIMEPFMEAIEAMMKAAGHDAARCILVAAHTFELTVIKA